MSEKCELLLGTGCGSDCCYFVIEIIQPHMQIWYDMTVRLKPAWAKPFSFLFFCSAQQATRNCLFQGLYDDVTHMRKYLIQTLCWYQGMGTSPCNFDRIARQIGAAVYTFLFMCAVNYYSANDWFVGCLKSSEKRLMLCKKTEMGIVFWNSVWNSVFFLWNKNTEFTEFTLVCAIELSLHSLV